MASLSCTRLSHALYNLAKSSIRASSTRAMPHQNRNEDTKDTKEVMISYLDGKDNSIAVLALNRPEARNALSKSLVSHFSEAISMLKQDNRIRVLIVRSLVPKIFCAGADLRERARMQESEVSNFVTSLREMMTKLESLQAPVISAIDGVALGGGLELALACDIRTASTEAKMGLVETKLAIIPGAGGTQRLPRIVGLAKAKELIFTGRILDGQQALEIGLVNQAVPQNKTGDAAYQAALSIAREILPNGPVGVKMAKKAISTGIEVPIENGLEIEKQCYSKLLETEDRLEGLVAFASKREPVYKGC